MRKHRWSGALASAVVLASLLVPAAPAVAATTYDIQVGQDFFEQGVPGFSARFYPGSIKVHRGDTLRFDFPAFGMGPQGTFPQELMGAEDSQIGHPRSFFQYDPDEGAKALKANLDFLFTDETDETCGSEADPCVWGPNSDVTLPAFPEEPPFETYVVIDAAPGTTLWGASATSPDVNVNFKVEVVPDGEPASTQAELDERADRLRTKDFEDAHALHERMGAKKTWHRNENGQKVYDVFVGASGGPVELFASYPRRISIPEGSRVQFHFMSQVEPHTATFGGATARSVFIDFILPACDPDGDGGTAPDVDPIDFNPETGEIVCPEGTQLEADFNDLLPWAVGDGKVTGKSDYENSGLIGPYFPEGNDFGENPDPMTTRFTKASDKKGFKFICLVHGGFMGGRVRVK